MDYYCVDRLEEGLALLLDDDDNILETPAETLALLDPPIREGDTVVQKDGRWVRDDAETARRRARTAALLEKVLARKAKREGCEGR